MSQQKLADKFGITQQAISSKELHHLFLYQHMAPHMQNHIDALMEELTDAKHLAPSQEI